MSRILVIDDNIDILQIVKVILENYGYEVLVMPDAEEALSRTDLFDPHLILMDVFLASGIDGRDICRALKSNHKTKAIPVIMFSAQTKMEDILKSCRADDFIAKPFEVKDLLNKIHFHISQNVN